MKLYRFSPIQSYDDLLKVVEYLDVAAEQLCKKAYGTELSIAGNIGIFTHYQQEYEQLKKIAESITDKNIHFNNKYFKLHKPISARGNRYEYLYIRQPDPYRSQVGDIDFVLSEPHFSGLKQQIIDSNTHPFIRTLDRTDVDMLEMFHPDIDVLSYIVPTTMSEELAK